MDVELHSFKNNDVFVIKNIQSSYISNLKY